MSEFKLPDVGEGLTEAEIVSWKVKVGDTIAVNDIVVEIETAKSLVELPSPYSGVVGALLVTEGATVPVGTPIIRIGDPSAAAVEVINTNVPPEGEVTLVGYGPREAKVCKPPAFASQMPMCRTPSLLAKPTNMRPPSRS